MKQPGRLAAGGEPVPHDDALARCLERLVRQNAVLEATLGALEAWPDLEVTVSGEELTELESACNHRPHTAPVPQRGSRC
jgi:hypothetical protein